MMRDRGLRQNEVAEALGVSEPTVSRWVNRGQDVPSRHIRPLADLLGVSPETVLANGLVERAARPVGGAEAA